MIIHSHHLITIHHNSSKSVLVFPFFLFVFITSEEDNKDYLAISVKFNNKIIGFDIFFFISQRIIDCKSSTSVWTNFMIN